MSDDLKIDGIYHFTDSGAAIEILSSKKLRFSGPKKIKKPEKKRNVPSDENDLNPKLKFDLNRIDELVNLFILKVLDHKKTIQSTNKLSNFDPKLNDLKFEDVTNAFPEIDEVICNRHLIPIGIDKIKSAMVDYFLCYIPIYLSDWMDRVSRDMQRVRIFCCLKTGEDLRMWNGYADEGRGVCFRFKNHLSPKPHYVKYVDGNPLYLSVEDFLQMYIENIELCRTGETLISDFRRKFVEKQFIYKEKKWDYENEIRYLLYIKNSEDYFYKDLNLRNIERIFLGYGISEGHEREIINLCRGHGISIYRTKLDSIQKRVRSGKIALL